jgi:tol-pal system protein YbgF
MRRLHFWLFVCLYGAAVQASAGLFTDDEAHAQIQRLETRVEQLEKANIRLEDANKQQNSSMLDLLTQIETLTQELRKLRGQAEELEHNLQDAKSRQKDFYVDLDTRVRHFEAAEATAQAVAVQTAKDVSVADDSSAVEDSAYEVIYAYYKAANYGKVIESGKDFIKQFQNSKHLPSVYYLMGDAYFSQNDFKKSIASYQVVVSKYEASTNVPDAWLNIAACQQQLKDNAAAKKTLKMLMTKYADSKAAKKAKKRLSALK